jgi:Tfp pilus assembly protein PilF
VSLLIDALKRAEKAKAQQSGLAAAPELGESRDQEPTLDEPLALAPMEQTEGATTQIEKPKAEPMLGNVSARKRESIPERLAAQRAEELSPDGARAKPAAAEAATRRSGARAAEPVINPQEAAKGLFAAKQSKSAAPRSRVGVLLMGGLALLSLAAGGFYLWYTLSFPPSRPLAARLPPPPPRAPSLPIVAASKPAEAPPGSNNIVGPAASAEGSTSQPAEKPASVDTVPAPAGLQAPSATATVAPVAQAAPTSAKPARRKAPVLVTASRRAQGSAGGPTVQIDLPPNDPLARPASGEGALISTPQTDAAGEIAPSASSASPLAAATADPSSDEAVLEADEPQGLARPNVVESKPGARKRKAKANTNRVDIRRSEEDLAVVDPDLVGAYDALLAGDRATAKRLYETALQSNPFSLDAYLGLASVSAGTGDIGRAQRLYKRALEIDPQNPVALAGLASVRGQSPGLALESRIKGQLSADPGSAQLHFALGNEYAGQARWAEAQQAYFDAYRIDPQNPDYAYNVAISLDQLNQPQQALSHYRRSLQLATKRSAHFSPSDVQTRIQELTQQ